MHFSDDEINSNSSLSKRYVWGRIRQVQSDSDTSLKYESWAMSHTDSFRAR